MDGFGVGAVLGAALAYLFLGLLSNFNDPDKMIQVVQRVEVRCAMAGGTAYIKGIGPRYACKDGSTGKLPDDDTAHPGAGDK